ncbi:hypothetical protein [Microbaculum sp. FT89]|uniref:hypothetical protein n=1 Tax=Microbaculum sp. FT89 TaxID=3447298 RepID=UPI003F52C271
MESQHRAVLSTVSALVDSESVARRDRAELIRTCRTLADWLRQYVEIAAEQSVEIQRLKQLIDSTDTGEDAAQEPAYCKPAQSEPVGGEPIRGEPA